jgi:hypothetical protein
MRLRKRRLLDCVMQVQVRLTLERNLMQCSTWWLSRIVQISNSRVSNGGGFAYRVITIYWKSSLLEIHILQVFFLLIQSRRSPEICHRCSRQRALVVRRFASWNVRWPLRPLILIHDSKLLKFCLAIVIVLHGLRPELLRRQYVATSGPLVSYVPDIS